MNVRITDFSPVSSRLSHLFFALPAVALAACGTAASTDVSSDAGASSGSEFDAASSGAKEDASAPGETGDASARSADAGGTKADAGSAKVDAGAAKVDAGTVAHADAGPTNASSGWLYTSGNQIMVTGADGQGQPWMGRGVNVDDIFLCGFNYVLGDTAPDQTLETVITGLVSAWKPTFIRISLAMDSNPTVASWLSNPSQYKTPMTNVIDAIGANPNVYVLVTLRSDASMIGQDTTDGDPEATGLPSDSTTTPNAGSSPTGTDATYIALVDSFANSKFVLFGLTNEPGGNKLSNSAIAAAMNHAVGVTRGEEDRLGVHHPIVSVQGNDWTSNISFYADTPIADDAVVYEVHGYAPPTSSYTYANIPVILGEYGNLTTATAPAFYADVESKQIPNLAWDFEPYSDCSPDLVSVTQDATTLTPTSWGAIVQSYLLAHPTP